MAEFLFYSCSCSDAFRQLLWKMPDPMSFSSQNNFFGWISPLKHFEHTEKGNFEQNLCQRKKRDVRITRSPYSTLVWDLEFSDGEWVERRREVRSADSEKSGWPPISNNLEQPQKPRPTQPLDHIRGKNRHGRSVDVLRCEGLKCVQIIPLR